MPSPTSLPRKLLTGLLITLPLCLLISPNFTYVLVFEGGSPKKAIGRSIYFLFLFLAPLFLFHKRLRWYFYLLLPLLPLAILANYLYLQLRTAINYEAFILVFDTTPKEAFEFATSAPIYYWLGTLAFIGVYFLCLRKMPRSISARKSALVTVLCTVLFFMFPVLRYGRANYADNLSESTTHFFPFNVYLQGRYALGIEKSFRDFDTVTHQFTFGAHKKERPGKEVQVLVIGESSRRDHWGLYGYERKTSPLLGARELTVFTDATSSGYVTNKAVPILLTRATARDFDLHLREKGLLGAFREAGFGTYWVTTQAGADSIYIHAKEGEHLLSPNVTYEEELAKILRTLANQEKKDKVFIVFQYSGSHWRYDLRYPDAFDVFKPSLKNEFATTADRAKLPLIVNSYDDSILYTDFVLNELIQTLDSLGVVSSLTYLSDHGENLLDDSRDLSMHAQASRATANIPLLVWTSRQYQEAYPAKMAALEANRGRKVSTENVFYSVLDLADVEIRDGLGDHSFAAASFKESERFMITEDGVKPYAEIK